MKYWEMYPLPKPYKTGRCKNTGIPIVKKLLHPAIVEIVDIMHSLKGCYLFVTANEAKILINGQPQFSVDKKFLPDLEIVLADNVLHYHDCSEYRLTDVRYKQIKSLQ